MSYKNKRRECEFGINLEVFVKIKKFSGSGWGEENKRKVRESTIGKEKNSWSDVETIFKCNHRYIYTNCSKIISNCFLLIHRYEHLSFSLSCSGLVNSNWQDSSRSVLDIYHELMDAGLRIWMFRFISALVWLWTWSFDLFSLKPIYGQFNLLEHISVYTRFWSIVEHQPQVLNNWKVKGSISFWVFKLAKDAKDHWYILVYINILKGVHEIHVQSKK